MEILIILFAAVTSFSLGYFAALKRNAYQTLATIKKVKYEADSSLFKLYGKYVDDFKNNIKNSINARTGIISFKHKDAWYVIDARVEISEVNRTQNGQIKFEINEINFIDYQSYHNEDSAKKLVKKKLGNYIDESSIDWVVINPEYKEAAEQWLSNS